MPTPNSMQFSSSSIIIGQLNNMEGGDNNNLINNNVDEGDHHLRGIGFNKMNTIHQSEGPYQLDPQKGVCQPTLLNNPQQEVIKYHINYMNNPQRQVLNTLSINNFSFTSIPL